MKTSINLLIAGLVCYASSLSSQVYTTSSNPSEILELFGLAFPSGAPLVTIDSLNDTERRQLYVEDSISEFGSSPYRIATLKPVNLSTQNSGVWSIWNTNHVWKAEIYAINATSLSLTFDSLDLPDGGELYIITGDYSLVCGPMTKENFAHIPEMSTEIFNTDRIIVYYTEPMSTPTEPTFKIKEIGYGYRDFDDPLDCHVSIVGSEGACFRAEQRSIAWLFADKSTSICTGALINNVDYNTDLKPYIITANHCLEFYESGLSNFGARFKYWEGNHYYYVTFFGARVVAKTESVSDAALLELRNRPSAKDNLFRLGWSLDRYYDLSVNLTNDVLHHPRGLPLKMSHDDEPLITNENPTNFSVFNLPTGNAWGVSLGEDNDFGRFEFGSSGAPLLNSDHLIRGTLKGGGEMFCEMLNFPITWFGKFSASWDGGDFSYTRFDYWLDPSNLNPNTLYGTFEVQGSSVIPCPGFTHWASAPNLTPANTPGNPPSPYEYSWTSSSNIDIISDPTRSSIQWQEDGNCAGCSGWVECTMTNGNSCGDVVIGKSVRKKLTWINPSPATNFLNTIKPHTNNNGNTLGDFNNICLDGVYYITTGFQGFPFPPDVVVDWTYTGNLIYAEESSSGSSFGFKALTSGIFTLTSTVTSGPTCMLGKTKTYVFQILSPCSTGWYGGYVESPDDVLIENNSAPELNVLHHTSIDTEIGNDDNFINIYPNPASSELHILIMNKLDYTRSYFEIVNTLGQVIMRVTPTQSITTINVADFNSGLYYVNCRIDDSIILKKVIVAKI